MPQEINIEIIIFEILSDSYIITAKYKPTWGLVTFTIAKTINSFIRGIVVI